MKSIQVLLVEDNPDDVDLTREAFSRSKLAIDLKVADTGEKALKYLRNEPPYAKVERPDLILLDIHLPGMSGKEVLGEIKKDPVLKAIPVVVLTASEKESDVAKCYLSGANCYIAKPVGFKSFTDVINSIEGFWFTVVKFPPKDVERFKRGHGGMEAAKHHGKSGGGK